MARVGCAVGLIRCSGGSGDETPASTSLLFQAAGVVVGRVWIPDTLLAGGRPVPVVGCRSGWLQTAVGPVRHDLSPWTRQALACIRVAGPLGTSLHNIAHAMGRRTRDLEAPLRTLVGRGLVARTDDGRYTAAKEDTP